MAWWIKIAVAASLIVAALVAIRLHVAGGQVPAQDMTGSVLSGRRLAEAWCTECHSVERATAKTGKIAPDFTAVAQRRSTTALSLRAFLQSDHKTMPNFVIEPTDADDIIAYIMSLRSR
jgi:cytochrome c